MHHPRYRPSNLIDDSAGLFAAAGCDGDKPAAIATALVEADLLGHTTHGLQSAPAYLGKGPRQSLLGRLHAQPRRSPRRLVNR